MAIIYNLRENCKGSPIIFETSWPYVKHNSACNETATTGLIVSTVPAMPSAPITSSNITREFTTDATQYSIESTRITSDLKVSTASTLTQTTTTASTVTKVLQSDTKRANHWFVMVFAFVLLAIV